MTFPSIVSTCRLVNFQNFNSEDPEFCTYLKAVRIGISVKRTCNQFFLEDYTSKDIIRIAINAICGQISVSAVTMECKISSLPPRSTACRHE
mmetsp:Transcript_8369/g.12354  ORF Transcript_8369/g.12354 Transcript_8369/m.12354 type:complete len:92 (-) Transcript_8369:1493-1768(-)